MYAQLGLYMILPQELAEVDIIAQGSMKSSSWGLAFAMWDSSE